MVQVRAVRTTVYDGQVFSPGQLIDCPAGVARTLVGLGKCAWLDDVSEPETTHSHRAIGLEGSDSEPPKKRKR